MGVVRNRFDKLHSLMANKPKVNLVAWCAVNTENEFSIDGRTFMISQDVAQYAVTNKAVCVDSKWNDWTNDAQMDKILVIALFDGRFEFYDENIEEIHPLLNILQKA
jgi:hypothetical protein